MNRIIPHSKPTLGKEEELAVAEVIRSGNIAQGEKVAEFEQAVAGYIGRKYAVAVSSGSAALHLSLLSLDHPVWSQVLIPSYTCKALYYAVLCAKAYVSLMDENESFGTSRPGARTVAIIPHTFGFANLNYKKVPDNVDLIEDCAAAIGGMHDGKMLGSFGKISVFSFYATKMITTGEGGMILMDDFQIAEKVRSLRDYTIDNIDDGFINLRFNYKMTDIVAAMGLCQLKKLDSFVDRRWNLSGLYQELLMYRIDVIPYPLIYDAYHGDCPAFHRYIVRLTDHNPTQVIIKMKARGIMCGYGIRRPLHRIMDLDPKDFPEAEKLANEVISLPLYPSLTDNDVHYIVKNFLEVLKECE